MIFVDTSAIIAGLNASDANHETAVKAWEKLLSDGARLLTTNYVLVESAALIQGRLGMTSARAFVEDIVPLLEIEWVDESLHGAGESAFLAASRRKLSFVDCVSFEFMRRVGIRRAFSFDGHFRQYGFSRVP